MAAFGGFIVLVLFIAGFIGLVVLAITLSSAATKRRREMWARVAHHLGLHYDGDRIVGTYGGQPVAVWIKVVRHSSGRNSSTTYYTVVDGTVDPQLDLGLSVSQQTTLGDLFGSFVGAQDIEVRDPAFDPLYVVKGDEPHRVHAMLGTRIREMLVGLGRGGTFFDLHDGGARHVRRGIVTDERWLLWAIPAAARLAALMHERRGRVPPASPLAPHRDAWFRFARQHGLAASDAPLAMWGTIDGDSVQASAVRTRPLTYAIEVLARYPEPLHAGFAVRSSGLLDPLRGFFGAEDHELGDPAFDRAFVVRGRLDVVHAVLQPAVRTRIVELSERAGPVQIFDHGVVIQSPSLSRDPAQAIRMVSDAADLARRIHALARPRAQRAAYR